MGISPRIIKRRIKSVRSTGKIMKAMELVAASKMRKAVQFALASRPYATMIRELADELRAALTTSTDPLLIGRRRAQGLPLRTLVVVIASDRGLCGGYNSQLLKRTAEFFRGRPGDELRVVTMGNRAERGVRRQTGTIVASFGSIANHISFAAAEPMLRFVLDEYHANRADRVFVVYTDFKSAIQQIPTVMQLLPILPEEELTKMQANVFEGNEEEEEAEDGQEKRRYFSWKKKKPAELDADLLFEPSGQEVLQKLLPRLIETRLYQTLLESTASEHSARMMAMRSAGEAARDMVKDLTLVLNQARQAAITQEISEISAGKAAIE